ncbi:dihydrolipoamide dehydrogenase [Enterococcus ratti]|uniref:dihydrolipoamide dehydrogenase n=1 Tax=Enterococcus ratti TaxID=150033 RepID=UPI003516CEA6
MKDVRKKIIDLTIDGKKKRLNAIEPFISKEGNLVFTLIFEDGSYLILDQNKQPLEYGPAADSYLEKMESYQTFKTKKDIVPDELKIYETYESLITSKKTQLAFVDCWIGVPEKRFLNYKNWRTPSGYLCGTYAAAVLLAYYQDFQNEFYLPPNLREKGSKDCQQLTEALRKTIQPLGLPTVPLQVSKGITKFLAHAGNSLAARSTFLGSWQRATKRIRQGKPVLLGVLKVLGSTYGNHWVTAYAYYESSSGARFYKVHDNWGNTQQIIPARWCNGTVSLP